MESNKKSDQKEQPGLGWNVVANDGAENELKLILRSQKNTTDKRDKKQTLPPIRSTSKRKAVSQPQRSSEPKKRRMDKDEISALIRETIEMERETNKSDLSEVVSCSIKTHIEPIKEKIAGLEAKSDYLSDNCDRNIKQIESLTKDVACLRDELKEELRSELKSEIQAGELAAHKITLSKEIEKISSNIIIHGLSNPSVEVVKKLFDDMKIETQIEVKRVIAVGKEGKKSCLVMLGDQYQRNSVLGRSFPKNLPQNVKIDKDMPRQYRAEYKKMQEEAFKHKCFYGVQCNVTFIGHELVLRYREKDDKSKGFTILRTWFPHPQKSTQSSKGNMAEGGPAPSRSITEDAVLEASRSFILPDIKDQDLDSVRSILEEELGQDFQKVREVRVVNNRPLIVCESEKSCRDIIKSGKIKAKTMTIG